MQFLFPSFLWGLLALSVPVIIHLFNFRRTKRVFFTNVAFLKAVETQTSSFRRVKQYLILASRILFLLFLVLAFAQPFLPAKNGAANRSSGLGVNSLYLDNSLSMQNTTENKRYLDLAVTKIDELLTLFRQSPNIQLITNDFSGEDQAVTNTTKVKDRLTSVDFSSNPRTLESVYKRQYNLAQKHNSSANNQFFWFSDFQKSTAGDLRKLKTDTLNKLFLVPVQGKKNQNVFTDSVWLASPFIREMQNNVLYVKVYNSGSEEVEKLPVKLFIDNAQASTASVNIAPNGSATATFNFTVKDKGFHRGKVSFDDQPITFDNDYYFVLNASPKIQILHLYQERSSADYIGKVFDNDSLFAYRAYNATNVDVGQFKSANLIVMEGVEQLSEIFKASLDEFVRNGGNLLVFPSERPDLVSYSQFLGAFGIQSFMLNNQPVLPQSQQALAEPNRQNPFFADVFERTTLQGVVNTPVMQAAWTWSGVGEKILTFKNMQNFITSTRASQGRIYVCASPLEKSYGNFAEHAFFVPTMFKIASMSSKQERTAYNFSEGSINLELPNAKKNATYKLKNVSSPNNKIEIIPIQRIVGTTLTLELPKSSELSDNQVLESGYYELQLDGKTEKLLALNHDNEESRMDFYSPEELRNFFAGQKNVTIFDNLLDGDFVKTFQENNVGTPLWKYCVMLALAFLFIEILLIRFMKG
ncbi:double-transmembrane region domain protein [Emticicia oligotrophica DSM 17448]|uniref:Double-transmembrane region domain protein n=1 Tax=Emticicia oligotrophica (strain DSM 17448 / CIP 109782 / MTCC 6937 / GPTSA100-15) TaxID=929562 RepID=A0ABN4AMN9_EMTOG|nr:BatA domain-containing protein [Emticicia oligotrophica]AFK03513.1 double-transmembrane region domain protein [Emticicia oligotrophica DSM 17448]